MTETTKPKTVEIIDDTGPTRSEIAWCKQIFKKLKPNDEWICPKSGLIFRREGKALIWIGTARIAMLPMSPEYIAATREFQYQRLKRIFEAAGIAVRVKDYLDEDGNRLVDLCKEGLTQTRRVDELMLEAFNVPRPPGTHCIHLDGNKDNCARTNLKWA